MNNMKKCRGLIGLLLAGACAITLIACTPKNKQTDGTNPQETLMKGQQDVFDQIASVATENAAVEVGTYVVPPESDFSWEETEGGVALVEYKGMETAVEIPAQLGGADVVEICNGAFQETAVVGVKLPDTVQTLAKQAFYYCTTLTEIIFGSGVKTVGESCFDGCVALGRVEMNSGLEKLERRAFAACQMLKKAEIPETVTVVAKGTFVMSGIESITIPGSVEQIGEQAFSRCMSLTSVIIESGVTTIGDEAFQSCEALTKVEIKDASTEIGWDTFVNCKNLVITAPAGSAAETYAKDNEIQFESN